MNRVSRASAAKQSSQKVPPGTYTAVVTAVTEPEGVRPGQVIDVTYKLTNESGSTFTFRERFFIVPPQNDRTRAFEEHLDQLGIERYEDYVGTELEVTILGEVKNQRMYKNIVDRKIISTPEGDGDGR